jgi:hypothetical protein
MSACGLEMWRFVDGFWLWALYVSVLMDESRAPPAESSALGSSLLSVSLLPMVAQPLLLGTDGPLPPLQDLLVLCMARVLSAAVFLV